MKRAITALAGIILLFALIGCEQPAATTTYTVTFDSQGGSAVAAQTIESGKTATEPTAPTKSGFIFKGWYKEAACTNAWTFASDAVSADVTLYAKWVDSNIAAVAGTWTGLLKSTTYVSHHINLPLSVKLGEDGKVSISWDYAGDIETHSSTYTASSSGVSFAITTDFDSPTTDGAKAAGTMTIVSTLSSDGQIASGTYNLDYVSATEPDEEGTIKVAKTSSGLVGKWMGRWMNTAKTAEDYIEVEFKSDGTFSASGVDQSDVPFTFTGDWSASGTALSATRISSALIGSYTYSNGYFPATIDGNYLKSGTYSMLQGSTTYTGVWSLGKDL
jgi:uncharacterized repeat protein (TIGR02543 family)